MGGTPRSADGTGDGLLARARLAQRIRATPDGGTCLLLSDPGYGRRTLLERTLGSEVTLLSPPPHASEESSWREPLDEAMRHGADRYATLTPWVAVLDLDPLVHADLLAHLASVAEECPTTRRIAISSSWGALPLFSRMRQTERLVVIDGDDLALDPEESLDLLASWLPDLDPEVAATVVSLCDGWTAALRSAAERVQAHPARDVVTWLRTQGAEAAVGPWLDRIGTEARDVLLDTAILDQLHPGLVDAVCGSGAHLLSAIASPGGALRRAEHPLTDDGPWFERHPLLTAALRYLAAGRPGEAVRHRRAADWLLAHGLVTVELEHRLLAGDAVGAVDRFHRHEDDLLESGQAHLALRWYQALPESGLAPEDLLREAWAYALSGRVPESRRSLARLRLALRAGTRSASSVHPELPDLDAEADVLEAWLSEQDADLVRMLARSTRAQVCFRGSWTSNSRQAAPLFRARAALHLGDVATAEEVLVGVRDEPFLSGTLGEGRRAATESELAWVRGEIIRARAWAARLDRWLRDQHKGGAADEWMGGSTAGFLAQAEGGEPQPAVDGLAQLAAHARDVTGNATAEVLARLALALVLGIHHGPGAGLEQLASAREVVLRRSPDGGFLPAVATLEARLRLAAGDARRAEQILRGLPPTTPRQLLLARAALLRGLPTAALAVRAVTPTTPREESVHALLQSWAALATSRERAEQQLIRAADVCAENGMTTLLVDVPEAVLEVARRAASYHVHDALSSLVTTADRIRSRDDARPLSGSGSGTAAALSRGDLQLLGMLPQRAGNAVIAEQLGISVNTVKTRLRRLYAKLDAHDRDDAIDRARAAGLLPGAGHTRPSVTPPG